MPSRILIVNFTEKEAEKISALPLVIDRGYLGDVSELSKRAGAVGAFRHGERAEEKEVSNIDFYFPFPIYEYKVVFINLKKNESLKKEFEGKTKKLTEEDRKDFTKYWLLGGCIAVYFIGDYNFDNLDDLGVPDIGLKKVVNKDLSVNSPGPERGKELVRLFRGLKSEVIMPTHYYIQLGEKSLYTKDGYDFNAKYLYWNNNNEDLGIFIDYDKGYSSSDRPRVIILPQFKNNINVVEKCLLQLAKLYPRFLTELPHSDWVDSDEYYPKEIIEYDLKIQEIIDNSERNISDLKKEKEESKKKYSSLRGLLTQTGDDLKKSVLEVLTKIFKINARDADESAEGLANEDIIVDAKDKIILMEVKGVKAENPSPIFIGQLWKHISQNKDKTISKGALVLNYDLETDPKDRSFAYKGEHEQSLEDIIFIDSRIMYSLGIAVIDFGMPPEDAASILLKDGRVNFNLDEYIESIK